MLGSQLFLNYLGRIKIYVLARGGVTLGVSFEVSKYYARPFFIFYLSLEDQMCALGHCSSTVLAYMLFYTMMIMDSHPLKL